MQWWDGGSRTVGLGPLHRSQAIHILWLLAPEKVSREYSRFEPLAGMMASTRRTSLKNSSGLGRLTARGQLLMI